MGIALLCLVFGGMLTYSSLKNQGILDVFAGTESDPITPKDYSSYTAAIQDGAVSGPPVQDELGASIVSGASGTKTFDGFPVAAWIIPELQWARKNGWTGKVTSGWRDPNRVITPSPGLPVAPQGKSNHNTTKYPGGAVDVSQPDQLEAVFRRKPMGARLKRDLSIHDPIHFSVTGR